MDVRASIVGAMPHGVEPDPMTKIAAANLRAGVAKLKGQQMPYTESPLKQDVADNAWTRLDASIDEVFAQLHMLRSDLAPVLGPDLPTEAQNNVKAAEYSQLGGRASYLTGRVNELIDVVRYLRDRLDRSVVA